MEAIRGTGLASQVPMKPTHELGLLKFSKVKFPLYHHLGCEQSRGQERKNSKRGTVTHDCEHGVRATMHDRELLVHVAWASRKSYWFATSKPVTRT